MSRAIDADKVEKWSWQEPKYSDSINDRTDLRDFLRSLPTLSPDDVRGVGEWEMHSDRPDTLICSICYAGFDVWKWDQRRMNYCPRCGARMKGAEENHTMDEFMYGQEMGSHSDGSL